MRPPYILHGMTMTKLLGEILCYLMELRVQALVLWAPSQWSFKHSLACHKCSIDFSWMLPSCPPWAISRFEQCDRFTLARTISRLTIDQALNNLSLNWMEACPLQVLINPFKSCKFKLSIQALSIKWAYWGHVFLLLMGIPMLQWWTYDTWWAPCQPHSWLSCLYHKGWQA